VGCGEKGVGRGKWGDHFVRVAGGEGRWGFIAFKKVVYLLYQFIFETRRKLKD